MVHLLGIGCDGVGAYLAHDLHHLVVRVDGVLNVAGSIIIYAAVLEILFLQLHNLPHQRMGKLELQITVVCIKVCHDYLLFCL